MENLIVCVTGRWRHCTEGRGVQSVAGPGQERPQLPWNKTTSQYLPSGKERVSSTSCYNFRESPAAWARPRESGRLVVSWEHLVACRLILLQKVKILRTLPNSKKIQAHWECGSLATMLFPLWCEVSYTVETTVNKCRDLTRMSPLDTLSLWSWKGQPAVSPQARIYWFLSDSLRGFPSFERPEGLLCIWAQQMWPFAYR